MNPKPIDYEYYEWLVAQIDIPNDKTYNDLFERMHNWEFRWFVPHDGNRAQDALDLRFQFAGSRTPQLLLEREKQQPSMLEVLIALSKRAAFTGGGEAPVWAWKLLKNLGLTKAHDPFSDGRARRVDDILDALIWRTYGPDGKGGFFPLKHSPNDQRKVEIWFQMNEYVMETEDL